jgi:hypothetical protein
MDEQRDIEAWALARAHEIMMRQGYQLVVAAQNLDRKGTRNISYELRQAIADSLMEFRTASFSPAMRE